MKVWLIEDMERGSRTNQFWYLDDKEPKDPGGKQKTRGCYDVRYLGGELNVQGMVELLKR